MNRNTSLERINENQEWDLAIIGGGASGLGIAVDAANRGFKTILAEKFRICEFSISKIRKSSHGDWKQ